MYSTQDYIYNPKTKLYVKKDTDKGKELIKQFPDHINYMEIDLTEEQIENNKIKKEIKIKT